MVDDSVERKKFVIGAYNAGGGRVATAQKLAKEAGKDSTRWDQVKEYLEAAGATAEQAKETEEYVDRVLNYESQFASRSKANKTVKTGPPRKVKKIDERGHWITLEGKHIFVEDK